MYHLPATKLDYQIFLSVKQNKSHLQPFPAKELLTHDASDKIILAAGVFGDEKEVCRLTSDLNASYSPALVANHEEEARALSYIVCIILVFL